VDTRKGAEMPFGLGLWEVLILLGIVALLFGTKKLPEMGRALGRSMREVKNAVDEVDPRRMLDDDRKPAGRDDAPPS